jgi:nucleoid DNA-binding protein
MNTLNKKALAKLLVTNGDFPTQVSALHAIETVLSTIGAEIIYGNKVSISGFGKFEPFTLVSGKVKPKFTGFKELKDALNF